MQEDQVADDEKLFRNIRREFVKRDADGILRFKADAFRDPEKKPSVDRAVLVGNDPLRSQISPDDAVASLIASIVRGIDTISQLNDAGEPIRCHIDLFPDPIKDDPILPDNPAHAKIVSDTELRSSAWKRLKVVLAELAVPEIEPPGI